MTHLPRLGPRLVEHQLDNGLRLVLLPDSTSSLVAVNLWYHVGARDDPPARSGLAHLFEHMLFQGSRHVAANEHFQLVQQVGGATNASTSFDRTNYYETLPPHYLELGLWLESDRMGFLLPALDSEKLEGQRSVVINERRQRIDNQPYGRAFEALQAGLYSEDHPYSRPIIGHMQDIEAASLADAQSFFRTHYRPSNAVLTLAGDIDADETVRLVRSYFDEIDSESRVASDPGVAPIQAARCAELLLEDEVALARIYFAWRGPAFDQPERWAGEILATTLAGGKSSPLYQDLVHQRQLAQDVTVLLFTLELESIFLVVATARPGIDLDPIEERLRHHVLKAANEPPSAEDFERARNQVVTGLFEQMESVESLADLLSQAATYFDDPAAIDREARRYFDCTREEAIAFAQRYATWNQALTLRVVPREEQP